MLDQLLESSSGRPKRATPVTVFVSLVAHGMVVTSLSIVPLIFYKDLPAGRMLAFLFQPPPPAPEPEPPPPRDSGPPLQTITEVRIRGLEIPPALPDQILPERPEVPDIRRIVSRLLKEELSGAGQSSNRILAGLTPLPVTPPPPRPPEPREPIRVGGNLQASKLIERVEPVYPELARRARVSGTVVLQVLVDEMGSVSGVKVISGHELLREAAVSAVRQWKYSPLLLNGEPVPVIATVTVQFVLR